MNRCTINDLPWIELRSPTRKFHSFCRNLSLALGAKRNAGLAHGGHPFDVQIRRIPSGSSVCPFHLHVAQWELFYLLAGNGSVRVENGSHAVQTGDVFVHPPGEAHQLTNTGDAELEVLIIADNPELDAFYYPDSKKWGLRPPGKFFRMQECDYLDGEDEAPAADGATYRPAPPPEAPPIAPFTERIKSIEAIAWEDYDSPKRKFRARGKQLSEATGAKRHTPHGLGGHPFDLEFGQVPPGFSGCPFHSHAAQWEFYIFLSGTGTVRTLDGLTTVKAGDVVLHPPGEAHQFTNTGTEPLDYFLIADNPAVDIWFYPDSNKWGFNSPRKIFRPVETPYWEDEE